MPQSGLDALVGASFCLFGLAIWRRTRTTPGALMILTGALWFLGGFVAPLSLAHRGSLNHLLVRHPRGRLRDRTVRALVVFGYLAALIYPIGASGPVTIVFSGWLAAVMIRGYRSASGHQRRAHLASTLASIAVFGALTVGALARMTGGHVDPEVLLGYQIALLAVVVLLFGDLWLRSRQAVITGLAIDLGRDRADGSLRDRIADALGDPSLELAYLRSSDDQPVDQAGRPVTLADDVPGRTVTPILQDGRPIAVLTHDSLVLGDRVLLESVAALTRIALANTRLQEEIQDRVAQVAASRARLVAVAETERARLEAQLQSGTQRRLRRVADLLASVPEGAALAAQLTTSQDTVREFARGVHPRLLTHDGLGAALTELASMAGVPVEVAFPEGRFDAEVEVVAYFVCAEGLTNVAKYADATKAGLRLSRAPGELVVEVWDDGRGGAQPASGTGLTGLSDRLDVAGGTLELESLLGGGTRLTARIPVRP
jgi:signal transduction histidine kinase